MGHKSLLSKRNSSAGSLTMRQDPLLPYSNAPDKSFFRPRALLRPSLYRRIFIWACIALLVFGVVAFQRRDSSATSLTNTKPPGGVRVADHHQDGTIITEGASTPVTQSKEDPTKHDPKGKPDEKAVPGLPSEEPQDQSTGASWLKFKHLNGYFYGLKTLVSKAQHEPEWPNPEHPDPVAQPPTSNSIPKPKPYNPYTAKDIVKCYLDKEKRFAAPSLYAYNGVQKHVPLPSLGSHSLLGIRDDVCFDRFGRYGPYGFGYSRDDGGSDTGSDTENSGSEAVWEETGKISYSEMDWGSAQRRCYEANKHRFRVGQPQEPTDLKKLKARAEPKAKTNNKSNTKATAKSETETETEVEEKMGRKAIVIRLYTGFKWTEHVLLNFRALINEVALKSGGEYGVHFLLHVREKDVPIWADQETVQDILYDNIPDEFHSMVTIWSVPQMKLMYPGTFKEPIANPSKSDIHGVYRSAHLPLQVFAVEHPEYDHIWNWEMDMRFLGNYYEFFDRIGQWAAQQPRPYIWERSERYYIPAFHGSWENFTQVVKENVASSGREPVYGPLNFEGMERIRLEEEGRTPLPESCDYEDKTNCGVGEDADFISLNPLFDADNSGWVFNSDVTGWDKLPPRRTAIITASRMSRRLLLAMHEEVWRHHHSMFTEMFPPSVALHHGLKGVYAPHPVFLDRGWYPASSIDAAFNGGRDHSTSGHGSPFDLRNEHNHAGASWYFNSEFAGLVWRRWLGYSQMDGRGDDGGRAGEGQERGGKAEEESAGGTGRMCLQSMLLHPIKREHPSEH